LAWAFFVLGYPSVNCGKFNISSYFKKFKTLATSPDAEKGLDFFIEAINIYLNAPQSCFSIDNKQWEHFIRAYHNQKEDPSELNSRTLKIAVRNFEHKSPSQIIKNPVALTQPGILVSISKIGERFFSIIPGLGRAKTRKIRKHGQKHTRKHVKKHARKHTRKPK
jgi:hypothetical protein